MKTKFIFYILISITLLSACREDEKIEKLKLKNLFEIEANSDNPVMKKRYEIYKKYNVPVYFNDTIALSYSGKSMSGDSIFMYETLDLQWSFTGRSDNYFKYFYQNSAEKQLKSLLFIENFLSVASKPLRPLSIFIVDSVKTNTKLDVLKYSYANEDSSYVFNEKISFYTGTRSILMSGIDNFDAMPKFKEQATHDIVKTMIKQRIRNYSTKLAEFHIVTDKNYYGSKSWQKDIDENIHGVLGVNIFNTWVLTDAGYNYYKREYGHTDEELIEAQKYIRSVIGKYGFVQTKQSYFTPSDSDEDLELFIDEILRYPKSEFLKLWAESPLVIKKSKILYRIIEEELKFNL